MTRIGWQIDPFYAWIAHAPNNRFGVIRAAVANDQHLKIGERLSLHAPNRIGQNATPIEGRDNNGYRGIHRLYIRLNLCAAVTADYQPGASSKRKGITSLSSGRRYLS